MSKYIEISDQFLEVTELSKKVDQLMEAQNFHKAIAYIINSNERSFNSYSSMNLKLAECFFKIGRHGRAFELVKSCLSSIPETSSETNGIIKCQLHLMALQIAMRTNDSAEIKSELKNLEEINVSESNEIVGEYDLKEFIAKGSEKLRNLSEENTVLKRKEEGIEIMNLIKDEQERTILNQEGIPNNLVSAKWFEKWRKYVFIDQDDSFSNRKREELYCDEFPGLISQTEIISENEEGKVVWDPYPVKEYTNYTLKENVNENQDFVILPHKVWKSLYQKYGGDELKRYRICINDETDETVVEVFLQKVQVIVFPQTDKDNGSFLVFQLSKKERAIDLKKKILRCLETKYGLFENLENRKTRLWNLGSEASLLMLKEKFQNDERILTSPLLNDDAPLEECEIAEEDFLLFDLGDGKNPIFFTKQEYEESKLTKCGNCKTQEKRLLFCECKKIKYCGEACQKADRTKHKPLCEKVRKENSHVNEKMKTFDISPPVRLTPNSKNGLTGLQNLGNTCFMNSSIQCLNQVQELTYFFLSNDHVSQINKDNKLGTGGYLASSYGELVKQLWGGSERYVSPWKLKKVIEKFAPQFSGYQQHDSQELLSYLLDGLHEDLNRVKVKPYIENVESAGKEKDEVVAEKSWEIFSKRNQSKISDIMTGQFKSTLKCPKCTKISITFDPFMTVSLPIPRESELLYFHLYFIASDSGLQPLKINMNLPGDLKVKDIKKILGDEFNIRDFENCFKFILIRNNEVQEILENEISVEYIEANNALLFVFEIQCPYSRIFNLAIMDDSRKKKTFERYLTIPREISSLKVYSLIIEVYLYLRPFISRVIELSEEPAEVEKEIEQIIVNKKLLRIESDGKELELSEEEVDPELKSLNIIFNSDLDFNLMKFNKCSEHKMKYKYKASKTFDLQRCFSIFTKDEILEEGNEWYCSSCKDHMKASKTMEMYKLPDILILHLKRFKSDRISRFGTYSIFFPGHSSKIEALIDFPLNGLNLSEFEIGNKANDSIYDCFAVSNHHGSTGGGHYTAFCKNFLDSNWYEFNDSQVLRVSESEIVRSAAYVLFYRRRKKL